MVFPAPSANGAGLRLRVAGIPVRFDTWFFIIGILLSIRAGIAVVVLWLVILGGSVLVHELGHALVARTTGASPEIVIHALGGLTSWVPQGEVSRGRRVAISLAGPAAGIALGLLFVAADRAGVGSDGGVAGTAIYLGIRVNILYGLFNLLPILPLDGGQTLRDLLPGDAPRRERTAAIVSIVVGAGAIFAALRFDEPFAAVFVAMFMISNFASLRQGSRPQGTSRRPAAASSNLDEAIRLHQAGDFDAAAAAAQRAADTADRLGDHQTAVNAIQVAAMARLDGGSAAEAKALLLDLPPGSVDPLIEGRVLLANGQPALGVERLEAAYAALPGERTAYHLAGALIQTGGYQRLLELVDDPQLPASVLLYAAQGALDTAAADVAGRIAELAGRRATGPELGQAAYLAARAWTRAGQRDRALVALRAAVGQDRRYAEAAGGVPEFAQLRGPEFDAIVAGG